MSHWIEATVEHHDRPVKINADNIAYIVQQERDGLTHVYFVGSNFASGKPDLLVRETPEVLLGRIEKSR